MLGEPLIKYKTAKDAAGEISDAATHERIFLKARKSFFFTIVSRKNVPEKLIKQAKTMQITEKPIYKTPKSG
jgi:hypothetical protein